MHNSNQYFLNNDFEILGNNNRCNRRESENLLKILTQKSFFFRIRLYTPKGPPKQVSRFFIQEKDLEK